MMATSHKFAVEPGLIKLRGKLTSDYPRISSYFLVAA